MVETMRSTRFWKKMELGEVARETTKKKRKKKRKVSTRANQLTLFLSFLFFSFFFFFLNLNFIRDQGRPHLSAPL